MKGAEIALLKGRLALGSGDDADIVIADSALGAKAVTLDVGENAVSIVTEAEARELKMFELEPIGGSTAIAIGPAEGKWEEIRARVKPEEKSEPAAPAETEKPAEESAAPREPAEAPAAPAPATETTVTEKKRHGCAIGCFVMILLLAVVAVLVWYFWPQVKPYYEKAAETVSGWVGGQQAHDNKNGTVPELSLKELADVYKLTLTEENGAVKLSGDLKCRAERNAIVALAYHADPNVKLDLSDPETLTDAVGETLFLVTEGTLEVDRIEGRKAWIKGTVINADELERTLTMLKNDVKTVEAVDASQVKVGVIPPNRVAAARAAGVKVMTPEMKEKAKAAGKPAVSHPIAGILTTPYPCVVMRSGERLIEGAKVGELKIERIEATKIVLKDVHGNLTEVRP